MTQPITTFLGSCSRSFNQYNDSLSKTLSEAKNDCVRWISRQVQENTNFEDSTLKKVAKVSFAILSNIVLFSLSLMTQGVAWAKEKVCSKNLIHEEQPYSHNDEGPTDTMTTSELDFKKTV